MPHKDRDVHREYQRKWKARRRADWFAANGPCVDCGTWDDLQLDHVDPATKIAHNVWSWSAERREAELKKCVTRCVSCHWEKTKEQTLRKRYCVHGHDTWECGRDNESRCRQCRVEIEYPKRVR